MDEIPTVDYNPETDGKNDLTFVLSASMGGPPMPQPGESKEAYAARVAAEGRGVDAGNSLPKQVRNRNEELARRGFDKPTP